MDIRHLRHFIAVADELHFGRAAARLNMEQAPLSQSIRRFEAELGVALFIRSQRGGTRLSPAGAHMLEDARNAVSQFDLTIAAARGLDGGTSDPVRVGSITPGFLGVIPAALKAYREKYAGAEIRLTEGGTTDLIERVAGGDLDIVLTNAPTVRPPGVDFELLRRDRTIAALPRAHRLAAGPPPAIADLAPEPLIFFPRSASPDLHDGILSAFRTAGTVPRIEQEASFNPTILSLVAAGLGYAFVQESATALPFPEIVFRDIADLPASLTWDLHLAWIPDGATASTRTFAGYLRDLAVA